jgi:hypothetical protein
VGEAGIPLEPAGCGFDQALLFLRGDARQPISPAIARPVADLDEDDRPSVLEDQVQLAAFAAEIAL